MCLVDSMNGEVIAVDRDLVHTAGLLLDPPIARQGKSEALQQKNPIDAVVPDEDHGLTAVTMKNHLQSLQRSDENVRQGLPIWNHGQVRRREPSPRLSGPARADFLVG